MADQENIDFERIERSISYIQSHFDQQPSLNEMAEAVDLSPFHFQRLFSRWAGISPKKFVQYLSLEYAKTLLKEGATSVFEAANETGLSSGSRLHDLFVTIERMTPGEFKNGAAGLKINYEFEQTPFGRVIVASTSKGVCHLFFEEDEDKARSELHKKFPNADFRRMEDPFQQAALNIFHQDWSDLDKVRLHIKATSFQIKVWEGLLKIPAGQVSTYARVAQGIEQEKAARAVGTAVGRNPVAFLIPCHRVIRSDGQLGGYMWGTKRKSAILAWEAAKKESLDGNS